MIQWIYSEISGAVLTTNVTLTGHIWTQLDRGLGSAGIALKVAQFDPHGKITLIYKKTKSFIENEKSWSNIKLASDFF